MVKMHKNELAIDETVVHTLLKDQFPNLASLPIKAIISSGTENTLFRLGTEYIIRLPRIEWAVEGVNKEYEWVTKISRFLKTPVSEPFFKGIPNKFYPWPWTINRWNDGNNPDFEKGNEYESLSKDLACFSNELHGIKLSNGPSSRRGIPLKKQDVYVKKAIGELEGEIDSKSVTNLWNQLSNVSSWSKDPIWVHGDFLPGNILVKNNRLSAVIDFSHIGIGDPACDLVIAWSLFESSSRKIFMDNLRNIDDDTWERGRGWALSIALTMLPYYKNSNPILVALAKRMLENVM